MKRFAFLLGLVFVVALLVFQFGGERKTRMGEPSFGMLPSKRTTELQTAHSEPGRSPIGTLPARWTARVSLHGLPMQGVIGSLTLENGPVVSFESDANGNVGPVTLDLGEEATASIAIAAGGEWLASKLQTSLVPGSTSHSDIVLLAKATITVTVEDSSGPLPGCGVQFSDEAGLILAQQLADPRGECLWEWPPEVDAVTITAGDAKNVATESVGLRLPRRSTSVRLLLAPTSTLLIETVDHDGVAIDDAAVTLETHLLVTGSGTQVEGRKRAMFAARPLGSGKYSFDRVPSSISLYATATSSGRAKAESAVRIASGETRTLRLVLEPTDRLQVTVLSEQGAPVFGAQVGRGESLEGRTDEEGHAYLDAPTGDEVVWAVAPGRAFACQGVTRDDVLCRLVMGPEAVLFGQALDPDDQPASRVRLTPLLGGGVLEDAARIALGKTVLAALEGVGVRCQFRTQEDGGFNLGGMPAGNLDVAVAPSGGSPFIVRGLATDVAATIHLLDEGDFGTGTGVLLRVHVFDSATGLALKDVTVSAFALLGGASSSTGLTRNSDMNGRVDFGFAQGGRFRFHAVRTGFIQDDPLEIEVDRGSETVELAMLPTGVIRALVQDPKGRPVSGALLRGKTESGSELQFHSTSETEIWTSAAILTDSAGRAEATVPAGTYRLTAMQLRDGTWVKAEARVVVSSGETSEVEMVLP